MKTFFRRLAKTLAYTAAALVILLAILVGLFRLFLPRLPEYQEDIKAWASTAIGVQVEFSGMDARWGLSGPEVEFYDAELISPQTGTRIIAAEEVGIGVGLVRLMTDRKFVVDQVRIRNTSLELRQLDNGDWWLQGSPPEALLPPREPRPEATGDAVSRIEIVGEEIEVLLLRPGDERPTRFLVDTVNVHRDAVRTAVDAVVDLPRRLGERLKVSATQMLAAGDTWDVRAEIDSLQLAGVSQLQPETAAHFDAGGGDVDLSLVVADKTLRSATATVDLSAIEIADMAGLALRGEFEFEKTDRGYLVAANDLQADTPTGRWPASGLRVETSHDDEGKLVTLDARATYLNLTDLGLATAWLTGRPLELWEQFDPSGIVRDLSITASGLTSEALEYAVSADFTEVGIAAHEKRPGFRGFSGALRADQSGGRLQIMSPGIVIDAGPGLGELLTLDRMEGNALWRRSNNRTTLLTDSLVLENEFLWLDVSAQLEHIDGDKAPSIDLQGSYRISDIAAARVYVPFMPKRPRTSQWFQEGLVSGRIDDGVIELSGPLELMPFEGDEGRLYVFGRVRDAVIIYQPKWPAARVIEADVAVENMRLWSFRNHMFNEGNEVRDGRLEIANFRQPVFTLSAASTGTLENLRQLSIKSPVGELLGGELEKMAVAGDAAATLDLRVPIRDWNSFTFTTRITTDDGMLQMDSLDPPLTDIRGTVIIEREDIDAEDLTATFLGRTTSIDLMQAPPEMPEYRAIANATGTATAAAISEEFGVPFRDRATGEFEYRARLLFPRGKVETPKPFSVTVNTDLTGLEINLPAPFAKSADTAVEVVASMSVPKGGERIVTRGEALELMSWEGSFEKVNEVWDFDRGLVTFVSPDTVGDVAETAAATTDPAAADEPATPETRGLHLRGATGMTDVQAWFDLARESESKLGLGDRVRSIDVQIADLYGLGQHLENHRLRVDRSARDWLIQIDGESISGTAFVPYELDSGRAITVEAERLILPGDESDDGPARSVDPRELPPLEVKAAEFGIGKRRVGSIETRFEKTEFGLVAESIVTQDDSFSITGSGRWVIDETDPAGQRSFIDAVLTSSDVQATMRRLDYDPGLTSDELSLELAVSWSGGPSEDLLESLDGEARLRIGEGQLAEVKPGAGRVFGLMSIAALPRRLALDFRDVFGKGFAFDKISGDFRLVDGDTYTCNLSLESPAADIAIVGRAGLVNREYEQTAIVNANFGNALPVAGALVAGPQVAAALLIVSQIFKKPLKEATQIYYSIGGDFDEPLIEDSDAELFAANGVVAGCIDDSQE